MTVTSRLELLEGKVDEVLTNHIPHINTALALLANDHKWVGRLAWAFIILTAAIISGAVALVVLL